MKRQSSFLVKVELVRYFITYKENMISINEHTE